MSRFRARRGLDRSDAAAMDILGFHPDFLTWCLLAIVSAAIGSSVWLARS
jgi:hypothetical protein